MRVCIFKIINATVLCYLCGYLGIESVSPGINSIFFIFFFKLSDIILLNFLKGIFTVTHTFGTHTFDYIDFLFFFVAFEA